MNCSPISVTCLAHFFLLDLFVTLITLRLLSSCFSYSLQVYDLLLIILKSYIYTLKTRKPSGIVSTSQRISLPTIWLQFSFIKCCRPVYLFSFIPFSLQLFIVSRLFKLGVYFLLLVKFCYPTSYPLYQQNVVIFVFLRAWTFSFFSWKTNKRERGIKQEVFICAVMFFGFATSFTCDKHCNICCPKLEINVTSSSVCLFMYVYLLSPYTSAVLAFLFISLFVS
jgi:hypothetical protein